MGRKGDWPDGQWIDSIDRRREQRVELHSHRARCKSPHGIALYEIEDISQGGARMRADFPLGTEIALDLYLPNDHIIKARARVVRRVFPEKGVGLLFDDLNETDRAMLRDLIADSDAFEIS